MVTKIDIAEEIIYSRLQPGTDLETLLVDYIDPVSNNKLIDEEKEILKNKINKRISYERGLHSHEVEDPAIIQDPEGHIEWYDDWLKNKPNRFYWSRHEEYVTQKFRRKYPSNQEKSGRIIQSLNKSSDSIIRLIENPQRENRGKGFQTKGLVVGFVQSGKTANFTAVIAKAADAGYRIIIVLTGIHNNLRSQTQRRMDLELTGEGSQDQTEEDDYNEDKGISRPELEYRRWKRITNYFSDFDQMNVNLESFRTFIDCRNPIIGALKKNCTVLDRFIEWISNSRQTDRDSLPILLIDDEADMASINTRYNPRNLDEDPSETNKRIRAILDLFPKNCYIGYTATPFANVLVDMNVNHPDYGRDIYPRNFIVSLPKPEDYFGSADIFGQGISDKFIRIIPDNEISQIVPVHTVDAVVIPRNVTDSIENSILTYILSSAVRYRRGDAKEPMTMLIHTTSRTPSHARMKAVVEGYVTAIKNNWKTPFESKKLLSKFKKLWIEDIKKYMSPSSPDYYSDFAAIIPYIDVIFGEIQIFELNYSTEDMLDYAKNPELKVIAIGGNKLSRGLTLEGLSTSLYLRRSDQYDTLLQMGRWFGYKDGYDDLTRVYTSQLLKNRFENLALVEEALREEIKIYEDEALTPLDVAVRIRSLRSMKVTAKNKMGRGQLLQESYNGKLSQTIWFPLDNKKVIEANLRSTSEFIKSNPGWKKTGTSYLLTNVPSKKILNYLHSYYFAKKEEIDSVSGLNSVSMLEFITRLNANEELQFWNVAVIGLNKKSTNAKMINWEGLEIYPVSRSRLAKYHGPGYNIGALSDPDDNVIDLPSKTRNDDAHERDNPLMIIYRIDKDSIPEKHTKGRNKDKKDIRIPLYDANQEKIDLIGLVFVFPNNTSERDDYIGQPLEMS
jgi:hypothetical protein